VRFDFWQCRPEHQPARWLLIEIQFWYVPLYRLTLTTKYWKHIWGVLTYRYGILALLGRMLCLRIRVKKKSCIRRVWIQFELNILKSYLLLLMYTNTGQTKLECQLNVMYRQFKSTYTICVQNKLMTHVLNIIPRT
jgi:hypothetical protein